MTNIKRLLTNKEACEYLGIAYKSFVQIVKKGEIGYVIVGKSKRYTTQELDRWLNHIQYLSDYTSEINRHITTHISRSSHPMATELTLEALREKYFPKKRQNGVLTTSQA